jgi:chromosomal replication initiator protein
MLINPIQDYSPEQIDHLRSVWQEVINYLTQHDDSKKIVSFLQKCCILSIDEEHKIAHIWVPNAFVLVQVKKFFKKKLEDGIRQLYHPDYTVTFDEREDLAKDNHILHINMKPLMQASVTSDIAQHITHTAQHKFKQYFGILFEHKYQFNTFVVGAHNQLAFAAAQAVVHNPWTSHNPLFLYGDVGLGKTHLMQAMGNAMMQTYPDKVIVYLPTTKLIDQLIHAMRSNKLDQFKTKIEEVDVLMLDDIQFLAGKEKTQELFHTFFNDLHSKGKQIVITSDQAPKNLTELEPRLQSRFALGLVVDIKAPDTETRIAIIQSKLAQKGITRESEWIDMVATHVTTSIRDIEGAINTIATRHQLLAQDMSPELIKESLSSLWYGTIPSPVPYLTNSRGSKKTPTSQWANNKESIDRCMTFVAHYFELSIADIKGPKRTKDISLARQLIMYVLKHHFQRTYEKIGKEFGRGHASVIYAVDAVASQLPTTPHLQQLIDKIIKYVG